MALSYMMFHVKRKPGGCIDDQFPAKRVGIFLHYGGPVFGAASESSRTGHASRK